MNIKKHEKLFRTVFVALVFLGSLAVSLLVDRIASHAESNTLNENIAKTTVKKGVPKKKKVIVKKQRKTAQEVMKIITEVSIPEEKAAPDICNYLPPENPEYKGEFLTPETDKSVREGKTFTISLYLKNTGNTVWFSDGSGCKNQNIIRLGTARNRDRWSPFYNDTEASGWLKPMRIALVEDRVDPGEVGTFNFIAYAPRYRDTHREYFQPVVERVQWMERKEETARVDIYIGEIDIEDQERLKYLNKSGRASSIDLSAPAEIEIDISDQKLSYKKGGTIVREMRVSSGTFGTPTPLGRFSVLTKQELRIGSKRPYFHMPWWMGFTNRGHGLHALPYLANDRGVFWKEALRDIGRRVSHGCVRMLKEEAEDLFNLVAIGTPIIIHE